MQRKVLVIFNKAAGSAGEEQAEEQLSQLFESHGFSAEIVNLERTVDLGAALKKAKANGCEIVAAAGGDGTVSAVAGELVGSEMALGVLPMGTLNHFAKDLGIPLDLEKSVQTICTGIRKQVDVGEVNGRTFINNSSLGLYPTVVRQRIEHQRKGMRKWTAFAKALLQVLSRHSLIRVRLKIEGQEIVRKTQLLFVGNNEYEVHGFELGTRKQLESGELCVYLTRKVRTLGLILLSIRALIGKLKSADQFDWVKTPEVSIETARKSVSVSLDGEVTILSSPLQYKALAKVLAVMVPRPSTVTQ